MRRQCQPARKKRKLNKKKNTQRKTSILKGLPALRKQDEYSYLA